MRNATPFDPERGQAAAAAAFFLLRRRQSSPPARIYGPHPLFLRCKRLLIDWKARSWQEIWQPEKTLVVGSTEKDRRTCWKFFGQAWRSLSVTTGVHSTGNLIFQRLLFFATERIFLSDWFFLLLKHFNDPKGILDFFFYAFMLWMVTVKLWNFPENYVLHTEAKCPKWFFLARKFKFLNS